MSPDQIEHVASTHRGSVFDEVCERFDHTPAELAAISPELLEQFIRATRPQMKVLDREVMLMSLQEYVGERAGMVPVGVRE